MQGFNKVKKAEYSIDRNIAIAEVEPHVIAAVEALNERRPVNSECMALIARLLASVGRGQLFPGMRNYIKNTSEFDAAIEQLRNVVGEVEEIAVKSGRR